MREPRTRLSRAVMLATWTILASWCALCAELLGSHVVSGLLVVATVILAGAALRAVLLWKGSSG